MKWDRVPLNDILVERIENPTPEYLLSHEIPIISKIRFNDGIIELRDSKETKTKMIMILPGDLVISGINAAKGAVAIYSKNKKRPISATIHYSAYTPKSEIANGRYVWWLFRSDLFRNILKQTLPGGIKTELKASRILPLEVPLPPMEIQDELVRKLDSLQKKVNDLQILNRKFLDLAEILKASFINHQINQYKPNYMNLGEFLSEKLRNGLSLPASQIGDHGICFAKTGIVNSGEMNPNEIKFVDIHLDEDSEFWMRENDIFVSRGNSLELVGKSAVYKNIPSKTAFQDLLIRIRVNNQLNPQYLSHYFHSLEARDYIESVATGTSPSMKKISQPKLKKMPIPIVTPKKQDAVVIILNDFNKKLSVLFRYLAKKIEISSSLVFSYMSEIFQ